MIRAKGLWNSLWRNVSERPKRGVISRRSDKALDKDSSSCGWGKDGDQVEVGRLCDVINMRLKWLTWGERRMEQLSTLMENFWDLVGVEAVLTSRTSVLLLIILGKCGRRTMLWPPWGSHRGRCVEGWNWVWKKYTAECHPCNSES